MIALHEIVRQYPKELQKLEFYDPMVKEYLHHHMLKYLFANKYSDKIMFIGGTALRYFYDLKRFSEDIDLDCFDLSRSQFTLMTDNLLREIQALGFYVIIEDKKRYEDLKAFRRVFVFPELKYQMGLSQQREAKFFIKVEAESQHYDYLPAIKTINCFGVTSPVRTMPLGILFSSKIAAAINRKKDRDFYDVAHLINFAIPDFGYLGKKCNIDNPERLKETLLKAASERKLKTRKIFDCEHMLFKKEDLEMIRSFTDYIEHFDFSRFNR
ncbi:MAG: nucleotidyl transferase AbiEii/AbiGii toxin family protein [Bacteroidales bacterium]|nr:nucleotidyl transferase AbiEii/AbiGii toxin family protein [Bacteroidales bacterium]